MGDARMIAPEEAHRRSGPVRDDARPQVPVRPFHGVIGFLGQEMGIGVEQHGRLTIGRKD